MLSPRQWCNPLRRRGGPLWFSFAAVELSPLLSQQAKSTLGQNIFETGDHAVLFCECINHVLMGKFMVEGLCVSHRIEPQNLWIISVLTALEHTGLSFAICLYPWFRGHSRFETLLCWRVGRSSATPLPPCPPPGAPRAPQCGTPWSASDWWLNS